MRWGRVEVSRGFLLLLAFLYYMDDEGLLLPALLACALHEGGHWLAARLWGVRPAAVRLTCAGAELRLSRGRRPGRLGRCAILLAGPAVNLVLALACARLGPGCWRFAGLNLSLGLFNLLPVRLLDGGRLVDTLLEGRRWGRRLGDILSLALSLCLSLGGLALMASTGNPTLLLTGSFLLVSQVRDEKKRPFCEKVSCNRGKAMLKY